MSDHKRLFEEFPEISAEQWVKQVVKDLKGESFDEKLKYTSADGIVVSPFYTAEDMVKYSDRKPLFAHHDWEISEKITVVSEKEANELALHSLNNGISGLIFNLRSDADLKVLLKDIGIQFIFIQFVPKGDVKLFSQNWRSYLKDNGIDPMSLNCSICFDPLSDA